MILIKTFLTNKLKDITLIKKIVEIQFCDLFEKNNFVIFSYFEYILCKMEFFIFDNVFYNYNKNYVSDQKIVFSKFLNLLKMNYIRWTWDELLLKRKVVYLRLFLSSLPFPKFWKQSVIYFGHKYVEKVDQIFTMNFLLFSNLTYP